MSVEISVQTPIEERKPLISKWAVVGGIILAILLLAGFVVLLVWLANKYPLQIEAVRDIFIIVFAAGACASVIVLIMLLAAVIRLINMLEFEIKPILEKTNETVGMVRGTTMFVSTNVVKPSIAMSSRIAGIRRGLRVLFGDPRRNLPD